MKYLIMEDFSGQPAPFIFPRRVDHADMREQLPYGKVLNAGFIEFDGDKLICYGGHAELDMVASEHDAKIIAQALASKVK